jgi:pyridoxamine 5'-phosphate oxidase
MSKTVKEQLSGLKLLEGPFHPFNPINTPEQPEALFSEWLQTAIDHGVREPHVMTFSCVDAEGRPDARALILKDVDAHGWHIAFTRTSPKGRQIAANAEVALTFYWALLGRQIRIRGEAVDMGPEVQASDFLTRALDSRAGCLLARQSDVLLAQHELEDGLKVQLARLEGDPGLIAQNWAVYAVRPREVEFWQGDEQRRHVRLRYRHAADRWVRELLWP